MIMRYFNSYEINLRSECPKLTFSMVLKILSHIVNKLVYFRNLLSFTIAFNEKIGNSDWEVKE